MESIINFIQRYAWCVVLGPSIRWEVTEYQFYIALIVIIALESWSRGSMLDE
jgi:hypothetical protein